MQRRRFGVIAFFAVGLGALHGACADDDVDSPGTPVVDASVAVDGSTSTPDSATTTDSSATNTDSGMTDAGSDASSVDAAADAPVDAADASPPVTVLYAHIQSNLYRIDPDTAAMTLVGPTGLSDVRIAWDDLRGELRGVVEGLTAPTMVTLDRCTGAATLGPRVVKLLDGGVDGGPLKRIECFAARPASGRFFGSGDWDNSGSSLSEALIEVNGDAGAATRIGGNIDTLQNDSDNCAFRGQNLYFVDVAATTPTTGSTGLYTWNTEDAGVALVGTTSPKFTRIGYEATRDTFFMFDSVAHQLVRVQPDGGSSVVGDLTMVADAAQADMDSLTAAPLPAVCP